MLTRQSKCSEFPLNTYVSPAYWEHYPLSSLLLLAKHSCSLTPCEMTTSTTAVVEVERYVLCDSLSVLSGGDSCWKVEALSYELNPLGNSLSCKLATTHGLNPLQLRYPDLCLFHSWFLTGCPPMPHTM